MRYETNTPLKGKDYAVINREGWKETRNRYENGVRENQSVREKFVVVATAALSIILTAHELRTAPESLITLAHCALLVGGGACTILLMIRLMRRQKRSSARTVRVAYIAYILTAMPAGPLLGAPYLIWVLWRRATNPARFNLKVAEDNLRKLRRRFKHSRSPDLAREINAIREEIVYLKDYPDYLRLVS